MKTCYLVKEKGSMRLTLTDERPIFKDGKYEYTGECAYISYDAMCDEDGNPLKSEEVEIADGEMRECELYDETFKEVFNEKYKGTRQ
ncbi:MAG: hypothetical protein ACI3YZ_06510 [Prevotella sp.]